MNGTAVMLASNRKMPPTNEPTPLKANLLTKRRPFLVSASRLTVHCADRSPVSHRRLCRHLWTALAARMSDTGGL